MGTDDTSVDRDLLARIRTLDVPAAAALELDDLLGELIDETVELLGADTSTVLLLDPSGHELFAHTAHGIEEEVRQGVRIPVGHGFAGRIAAERRPVALDRVDPTTVANPILWHKGIQTMLGVPMVSAGELLGVMHVGRMQPRPFDDSDIAVLQAVADRAASAVHVRLLAGTRTAAEALQRSLLPSAPARLADFEFAARYVPTEHGGGVGGDWYDVFSVDDVIWIVTGDVVGHGLRAATIMGRVRSALRAYALLGVTPDEVLAHTDRKIRHFEVGEMVTVASAMVEPPYDTARVAVAGHPPIVVARPDQQAEFVDAAVGPPLGAGLGRLEWPVTDVPIDPGGVLFFYTDGLIERRDQSLDVGLERLRSVVRPDPAELVCQQVMAALIGDHEPDDDIAVLAARRVPRTA